MSDKPDLFRKVRRRKSVVGPRQASRRIKEHVDSFFNAALQQVNQNRQQQSAGLLNISSAQVNSLEVSPLQTTTYPAVATPIIDNHQLELQVSSLHHEHVGYDEPTMDMQTTSMYASHHYQYNIQPSISPVCDMLQGELEELGDSDNDSYHNSTLSENGEHVEDSGESSLSKFLASLDAAEKVETAEETSMRSIAEWVIECNIPRCHVSNLLKRLKNDCGLDYLPLDSRTLLKSLRSKIVSKVVSPGSYYHFGIMFALSSILSSLNVNDIPDVIEIIWNIDGIPLTKSSGSSFWPILGRLFNVETLDLMVVGIYSGFKKPEKINEFLNDFVSESNNLFTEGFEFRGKRLRVKTAACLFDAPARSFATSVVPHNSYFACHKCVTKGIWVKNLGKMGGRVTYPELNAQLRTDKLFRERAEAYRNHFDNKKDRSIIENILEFNIIDGIPLDYMHLVCLGVMKKMLNIWISGKFDNVRLSKENRFIVSNYLESIKRLIPSDFSRKTRTFDDLPHFKATEYRLQLLYIAAVAFRNVLSSRVYKHFLLLHVAIKILANESMCKLHAMYAKSLLQIFIEYSIPIYGEQFISYNVHNLIHLADDVLMYGPLDNFSAFPFENKLQKLKNLLRHSAKPLEQIVKRIHELEMNPVSSSSSSNSHGFHSVSRQHNHGPLPKELSSSIQQFERFNFGKWSITTSAPDNSVLLLDDTVMIIENIIRDGKNDIFFVGKKYRKYDNLYMYPLPSMGLKEIVVSEISSMIEKIPVNLLYCKVLHVPMSFPPDGFNFVSPLVSSRYNG